MSQQLPEEDLDRTDELPQLDIAAYEASMRPRQDASPQEDPLSRTDTWVIKALQDADIPEDVEDEVPVRHLRAVAEPAHRMRPVEPTPDVTAEVDSILRRIDQLESELAAARSETQQWQNRCSELTTERAEQEARTATLTANNARLVEQQQIAYDRTQTLEARLREEGELAQRRLNELQATLQAERDSHGSFRRDIEQQLSEARAQIDSLTRSQQELQSQLRTQTELAATRAREVADLQGSLNHEHRAASDMARLLASKLADYDALAVTLERRESALTALESVRADLAGQLEAMTQAERQRADELAQAQARLTQAHRAEQDLQRTINERQQDLAQRDAQIQQLRTDLARTIEERDAARSAHSSDQSQLGEVQSQLAALEQERGTLNQTIESLTAQLAAKTTSLEEAQRLLDERAATIRQHEQDAAAHAAAAQGLRSELETALAQVVQAVTQRDQLTTERDELATRVAALSSSLEELQGRHAAAESELETLRGDLSRALQVASDRAESLEQLQQSFEEARTSTLAVERSLESATAELQRLHAKVQEQARDLEAQELELAASRAEVGRQARAQEDLERAVSLRDELLETLRHELQTVQDERGAMATQLEKARGRTKTLAERIFKKDARIAALKAELAVHTEALATLRREPRPAGETQIERVLEPVGHEAEIVVLKHKVMTVGRTDDNDVCVPSKMVSRRHARLLVGPNAVIVEDTGSTNGCYVNDHRVQKHLLREGDVLLIGDRKFKLRTRQATASLPAASN